MMFAPEQEQGEFNQATAYQYRLHIIFFQLDDATLKQNYDDQYRLLRTLYKELYPMMNETERAEQLVLKSEAVKAYSIYFKTKNSQGKMSSGILDAFDNWELKLRDITQSKNMLMPRKKDSRYALV